MVTVLLTGTLALVFLHYFAVVPAFLERPYGLTPDRQLALLARWALISFAGYFLLPGLVTRFGLGERLSDFGLTFKGFFRHLPLYLLLYLLMVPVIVFVSSRPDFQNTYPFAESAREGGTSLLVWELLYGLQFFSLEFFFRGFLLFGLERRFGYHAIFVMVVPYCMLHFYKPLLESLAAVVAGVLLGALALRTRSVMGGVLIHWSVAVTMDVLAILQTGGFR